MRRLALLLFLCLCATTSIAAQVPAFTPNVVDPSGVLEPEEVQEINDALKNVRDKTDIWGAVFVVDTLGDDSIEALAERAFRVWKLGAAGRDNGLLLVLAMKEHRSRFEVGYGLEGDLPDVVAKRALDEVLRPLMRRGETKAAIIQAFSYMAEAKSKDPSFHVDPVASETGRSGFNEDLNLRNGWIGLLVFYFCLWILAPLAALVRLANARRLSVTYPAYDIKKDGAVNHEKFSLRNLFGGFFIKGFLTLNPGAFVFFGSAWSPIVLFISVGACVFFGLWYFLATTARYRSRESYERYQEREWKRNQRLIEREQREKQRLIDKGYMRETSPGVFDYTPAYYSSFEYRMSQSSSSGSSSSSSSSSGGGSSGGGGASSSW